MPDSAPVSSSVPGLDPVAAARWQQHPALVSPWLNEEIARRMAERLDWIRQVPQDWVHWSPLAGGLQAHAALSMRYPEARSWLAGELLPQAQQALVPATPGGWSGWWSRRRAAQTGPALLPADATEVADLVWANQALHLCPQPAVLLRRWRELLRVGGFAMFSGLGPDTLRELRAVHAQAGWPVPTHPLTDMHDWGDMLVETGFAEPVVDMERITLTYPNAERLLVDLRAWGRNLHTERHASCRGRGYRQAWLQAVERGLPRDDQGQLCVTVEVIYGHAFKPRPRVPLAQNSAVSLQDMRALLRQPKPSQ